MSDEQGPAPEPAPPPAAAPAPARPRTPWTRRFLPLLLILGGVVLWTQYCTPREVDVVLALPSEAPAAAAWDLRVTRLDDGAEVRRARRELAPGARSLVLGGKLQRGRYRVEGWPARASEPAFEGTLEFDGQDVVEVRLAPRAPAR